MHPISPPTPSTPASPPPSSRPSRAGPATPSPSSPCAATAAAGPSPPRTTTPPAGSRSTSPSASTPPAPLDEVARRFRSALADLPDDDLTYTWSALQGDLPPLPAVAPVRFNYQPAGFRAAGRTTLHSGEDLDRGYLLDAVARYEGDGVRLFVRRATTIHRPSTAGSLLEAWTHAVSIQR